MKIIFRTLLIVILLLSSSIFAFASGFQLKTIGVMNVDGTTLNHLYYSSTNVTFTGEAVANATVTAQINSFSESVTADSSGSWSYSGILNNGDNIVSFTSNDSTISFTLTIGEVPAGVGSLTKSETPTVGTATYTIEILLAALVFIIGSVYLLKRSELRA